MKTYLFIIIAFVTSMVINAQTFTVDGLNYNVISTTPNEVEITGGTFTNPLIIPSTVEDAGITYTVTTVGSEAFRAKSVTSVVLPNTLTTIKFRGFRNNGGLTTVTLPDSVTSIESEAFAFGGLNEIIAEGTTPAAISNNSFGARSGIDLIIPDGVEQAYLDGGWTGFATINGELTIGGTFVDGELRYRITSKNPNEASVSGRESAIQTIVISETAFSSVNNDTYTVITVDNTAFRNTDITSVELPSTLVSIGNESFRDAPLTSVTSLATIPPTLSINSITNRGQINLTIPDGTEEAYLDGGWTGFATINGQSPLGTIFIDGELQYRVTSKNPNEASVLGRESSAIQAIVIPETASNSENNDTYTVTTVENTAFKNTDITSVELPSTLVAIGNESFRDAPLTSVTSLATIPPTLSANSITNRIQINLTIPDGTEEAYLDGGWTGFAAINGESPLGTTFIDGGLSYKITLKNPNEVEVIDGSIATDLVIPEIVTFFDVDFDVTAVAAEAFRNRAIANITLGANIQTIGELAFAGNSIQSTIVSNTIIPPTIGNNAIARRDQTDLIVPVGTELDYLINGWTGFRTINGEDPFTFNGFEVDNLLFTIISINPNEVETSGSVNPGAIVIPASVNNGGVTYAVTQIGTKSFENNGLTNVTLPNSIKIIKKDGFSSNQLTTITIPNSVVTIEGGAFQINDLATVTIPNSVTSIGGRSFANNALTSVVISENLTIIPAGAFSGNLLTDVVIPQSITNIEQEAFQFSDLTEIIIPDTVTDIGNRAFENNSLTQVTFGNGVTTIGESAFKNNSLTQLTFGDGVTTIGESTFENNPLSNITATGVTPASIENNSFGNRGAISLVVPEDNITDYELAGWTGFESINGEVQLNIGSTFELSGLTYEVTSLFPDEVKITESTSIPSNLVITETINRGNKNFTVVSIGSNALQNKGLTSIQLPNTITEIGASALSENQLTTISLPENLSVIQTNAFSNNQLSTINFPNSTFIINNLAFQNNQISNLILPSNTSSIGVDAFNQNPLITIISEGNVPATISDSSFGDRGSIDLTIPTGTETAYEDAAWTGFFSTNNQLQVEVGDTFSVAGIEYSILSVSPNTLAAINKSGTVVGGNFIFPDPLERAGTTFSVTTIGNSAFRNKGVNSLTLPSTLTTIEFRGFRNNSNLTSVTLPANVTSIGNEAFFDNGLIEVISEMIDPPVIAGGTFGNRSNIDLIVPPGTIQTYVDNGWTGFKSISDVVTITVAPKVFLQGASLNPITGEEDLMRDSLRQNALLPTISPYGDGATVDPIVFNTTGVNAIVDWVFVELRQGSDNSTTTVVSSQAALLQRDGDIVGLDGSSTITFTEEEGTYFIAIKHRNHIGILAAVPTALSTTASNLDFTQDITSVKGENLALTTLLNGNLAMIAGDADGSSNILNTDITEALTLSGGGQAYSTADADMNGFVLNSDIQLLVLANSGTVQQFE